MVNYYLIMLNSEWGENTFMSLNYDVYLCLYVLNANLENKIWSCEINRSRQMRCLSKTQQ